MHVSTLFACIVAVLVSLGTFTGSQVHVQATTSGIDYSNFTTVLPNVTQTNWQFGYSMDILDSYMVVGNSQGQVVWLYYELPNHAYRQIQLVAPDVSMPGFGNQAALGVGISGVYNMVVSAQYYSGVFSSQGAAVIFSETNGPGQPFTQVTILVMDDANDYDYCGETVAIYGDTVVVGCPQKDNAAHEGAVYVFAEGVPGAWAQLARLSQSAPQDGARWGTDVAIHGNYLVGCSGSRLHCTLFERTSPTIWEEHTSVTESVGNYAAIQGNTLVFGNPDGIVDGRGLGIVYVYNITDSGVTLTDTLFNTVDRYIGEQEYPRPQFGKALDIYGDNILIGAEADNLNANGNDRGSLWLYAASGNGTYELLSTLYLSTAIYDEGSLEFGHGVAIGDHYVGGGAPRINYNSGAVYLFEKCNGTFSECACAYGPTCLNGGVCIATDTASCDCSNSTHKEGDICSICTAGYTGVACEIDIDECASNITNTCADNENCIDGIDMISCESKCSNCTILQSCTAPSGGAFECTCDNGWVSTADCSDLVCSSNPCLNGATCAVDQSDQSPICECTVEYEGQFCDLEVDLCILEDPCAVNGTCIVENSERVCECDTGWTNTLCDEYVGDCSVDPCVNDGICQFDRTCACPEGYQGITCADLVVNNMSSSSSSSDVGTLSSSSSSISSSSSSSSSSTMHASSSSLMNSSSSSSGLNITFPLITISIDFSNWVDTDIDPVDTLALLPEQFAAEFGGDASDYSVQLVTRGDVQTIFVVFYNEEGTSLEDLKTQYTDSATVAGAVADPVIIVTETIVVQDSDDGEMTQPKEHFLSANMLWLLAGLLLVLIALAAVIYYYKSSRRVRYVDGKGESYDMPV